MPLALRRAVLEQATLQTDATCVSSGTCLFVLAGTVSMQSACNVGCASGAHTSTHGQHITAATAGMALCCGCLDPQCIHHAGGDGATAGSIKCSAQSGALWLSVPLNHLASNAISGPALVAEERLAAVQGCQALGSLSQAAQRELAQFAAVQHHAAGTVLLATREVAAVAFLILQGACSHVCDAAQLCGRLSADQGRKPKLEVVAHTQQMGEVVGLVSCLQHMPLWADVRAATQVTLLAIPAAMLRNISEANAGTGRACAAVAQAKEQALRQHAVAALADVLHGLRLSDLQLDAAAEAALRHAYSKTVPASTTAAALPFPLLASSGPTVHAGPPATECALAKLSARDAAVRRPSTSLVDLPQSKQASAAACKPALSSLPWRAALNGSATQHTTCAHLAAGSHGPSVPRTMLQDVSAVRSRAEHVREERLALYDGCSIALNDEAALHASMPNAVHDGGGTPDLDAPLAKPISAAELRKSGNAALPDAGRIAQHLDNPLDIAARLVAMERAPAVEVHAAQSAAYDSFLHCMHAAQDLGSSATAGSAWQPLLSHMEDAAKATQVPHPASSSCCSALQNTPCHHRRHVSATALTCNCLLCPMTLTWPFACS